MPDCHVFICTYCTLDQTTVICLHFDIKASDQLKSVTEINTPKHIYSFTVLKINGDRLDEEGC